MKMLKFIFLIILSTFSNSYTQDFWEETTGPDTTTIWSLAINSSGYIFAGTHNDGVFRSTDNGASWTNLGILNYPIRSIAISSSDDILVNADLWGDIYRSYDNGNNWDTLGFPHFNQSIAIYEDTTEYIYVGTGALGISRTTDNGANWEAINNGMTASKVPALVINSSGDVFAGTYVDGIFRTTDKGANWVQINTGLSDLEIRAFAINSNGDIFAGTQGGGIFRSSDNGDNWVQKNSGIEGQGLQVFSLALNSVGDIFAGTDNGIYRSLDNGDNWMQISTGLSNSYIKAIVIAPNDFGFTGTEAGIFRSVFALPVELNSFSASVINNKSTLNWETTTEVNNFGFDVERKSNGRHQTSGVWEKIGFVEGNGNSNSPKEYFFIDEKPIGESKFKYRLKQIDNDGQFAYSEVVEIENVPIEFALHQNYPNPFNPTTKIRYQLPKENNVTIKIYDLLGSEVATLLNENKESGIYEVELNAQSLSSGTYIYRMVAGDFISTMKLMLLK